MTRLVAADLHASLGLWIHALVSMIAAAAVGGGVVIAIWTGARTAASAAAPDALEGVWAIGGTVGAITLLAAAGIIGSTCGLGLSARSREHALWLLTGMRPRQLRRVLRAQILVLSLLAALIAVPLSGLAAAGVLWQWSGIGIVPRGQGPLLSPLQVPLLLGVTVLVGLWGGAGPIRRATCVSEMRALRDPVGGSAPVGWTKALAAAALVLLSLAIAAAILTRPLEGGDDRAAGALSASMLMIAAILLVPAWTLRPLLHLWTGAMRLPGAAWHLVRASCRHSATRSLTTIVPFAVATSLFAVLGGATSATSDAGTSLGDVAVVAGPALLISWIGGVCVIAMVRRERARDDALLAVTGAPPRLRRDTSVLEGLIYAVTAVLVGALVLAGSVSLMCAATSIPLSDALPRIPWGQAGALALLTVGTSIGAVLLTGRRPRPAEAL